ncbi:cell division protein FtsZ [Amylibacter sp. SFDW26]|uniref:cell division protein FtsZ n=1 Tax=Amylibacter sp. SFDW26 TaxID=2652722 RepID=UPI0012618694|nr:cell division protein FtsZ [Amylibacter sp. SFDW26]KAB7610329.1 cell division protein FtsZ [Amylibacter sp. SFDW26]
MTLNLRMPEMADLKPHIAVFGVGGAGGNAVNNMIEKNLEGVDFVVANTDAQALQNSKAQNAIQIGEKVTEGLGAGARPSVGAASAEESIEAIVDQLVGCHMCFITAGMGGGTGTGAAPIIAQAARELGVLTVGVVTKPFQFEGNKRMRQAEEGVEALQKVVDTLIVIPNQNLFRIANEKTTFTEAFQMADDVLYQGVKGVTDLMVRPGIINLDFADIRAVMDEMGKAMMGTGESTGEDRAIQAAEKAIANPLLDEISLKGAHGVLINITGGHDLTLFEMDEAANRIREEVDENANIIVGSTLDTGLEGVMRVSVVATGIDAVTTVSDIPVPRRSMKEPLAQAVSFEQQDEPADAVPSVEEFVEEVSAEPVMDMPAVEEIGMQEPDMFESAAQFDEPTFAQTETDDLPPPAYQPAAEETADDFFQMEEEAAAFVAPQPQPTGQPSSETMARLHAAASKAPTHAPAPMPAQAEATAEKRGGFGLNSLISKMTGHSDDTNRARTVEQPNLAATAPDLSHEEPAMTEDQERIEIPAFLRRQAN